MRENTKEIPVSQKPSEGEQENSLYLKAYQVEKKKIEELSNQIIERLKFLEKEQDPEIRKKIEAEIEDLKGKKLEARINATQAINDQRLSEEDMENEISNITH